MRRYFRLWPFHKLDIGRLENWRAGGQWWASVADNVYGFVLASADSSSHYPQWPVFFRRHSLREVISPSLR